MSASNATNATNASSGNTTASAGAVDTSTQNTQLGAGVAASGTGSMAVDNQHSSSIVDSSAASAKSGVSVALVPTPAAGATPPSGVTTAHSGDSTAVGITASNDVANTSLQAVTVNGANQAPVSLTSKSNIAVQDTGASGANSGAAWAVAPGAAGAPSGVATPSVAGAAATSAPVSATGLQAQTNLSSATTANVNVAGGPNSTSGISIAPTPQVASAVSGGVALASSGAACSGGAACPAQASTPTGSSQATSGAANAQGLVAQNTVNTNAVVAVKVAGQNFAPIRVVVDSITQIFNWGVASSSSGDSTAGGSGSSGAAGQAASSGSAQATGAQVQNAVNLRSSASVKVNGDNYNPINIILNLAANLVNWGAGFASSGDAQANGNGGGAASTGASSATGLQVSNLVNMWADAAVDIEGNNYAPITVDINFRTNIDNRGYAGAASGNVAAGKAGANAAAGPTSTSGTPSSGSSSSTRARGGDAVAVSNSVTAAISSNQISSANGGSSITSSTITNMLRNLPPGSWSPFAQTALADTVAPSVPNGVESSSGNSTAKGLVSTIAQTNEQIAACSDPLVQCFAVNTANLSTTARDLPRNPATVDDNGNAGPGGTHATSEFAGVNATPTPTPVAQSSQSNDNSADRSGGNGNGNHSGRSSSSSGSSTHTQINSSTVATGLPANGHVVLVDLWDQWPGRRLPPMPNPRPRTGSSGYVDASLDAWPGADELPLPDPSLAADPASQASSGGSGHQLAIASHDAPTTDAVSDDDYPPLDIQDFDPLGGWPGAEVLPMPLQVVQSPTVAGEQAVGSAAGPAAPDLGVTPVAFGVEALLSLALGALGGLSRGRGLLALVLTRLAYPLTLRRRFTLSGLSLGQQTARGLALLRLTLGILRLW